MSQPKNDDQGPRSVSRQYDRSTGGDTVILLGGLPASGKTTLARQLMEHYGPCAVHLEYDDIEESLTLGDGDRREAWNGARRVALKQLEEHLLTPGKPRIPRIFFMDDNFHLRGMRKQIHRLLLAYKPIRFGILWMQVTLEECIVRNQNRKRQVPSDVIEKMIQSIETPRAAWEAYWLKVDPRTPLEDVIAFIDGCLDIVDLPDSIDEEQQEADRQSTLASQSSNLDKMLRGWVRKVALYDKSLALQANEARKEVMKEGKHDVVDRSAHDMCAQFVSFIVPDDEDGCQLKLLQLLTISK